MIRPLVNENDLQILDQLNYDKLRPEFVEKALTFRKRITSSIKCKTLNNKKFYLILHAFKTYTTIAN